MDKTKIERNPSRKSIAMSIRIPIAASRFLKENNYSPTAILMEAIKDLGWKDNGKELQLIS